MLAQRRKAIEEGACLGSQPAHNHQICAERGGESDSLAVQGLNPAPDLGQ